ncbi:MAG: hypothetical protein KA750_02400, partial [Thermoflexales bacterium]|nr:hypothetical protein [Thermoflexales bacterium]
MDQNQAVLQRLIESLIRAGLREIEEAMRGKQTSTADAILGVAGPRPHTLDQFYSGPESAGILPSATRAGQPFAQDRAGC